MTNPGHHFIAVIGGAISGSVAAEILADHGIRVAVFEQNTRPYGKIEDGLPRWQAEQYVGKGLVYQNPFIYWYNHKNEKDYLGPRYETPDEAVVMGGGLASIDVVKVLQLENYERALRARGIQTSMHELEKGIPEA